MTLNFKNMHCQPNWETKTVRKGIMDVLSANFNYWCRHCRVVRGCAGGRNWGVRQNLVEISTLPLIPVV